MSLATRCTACGTIFRVVRDQLKVSDGWVRCGRCDEVFDALENLFDLERDAPPPWQPGRAELGRHAEAERVAHDDTAADLDESDRIASRFFHDDAKAPTPAAAAAAGEAPPGAPPEAAAQATRGETVARAAADEARAPEAGRATERGAARDIERDPERHARPATDDAAADVAPTFVRAADAQAHWSSPRTRLGLALAAALLAATLAMQLGHHFRDRLAADHPGLAPLLAGWCAQAGCPLEAPRRIEDISVENTALARAAAGTDTYRLTVTLRNRGSTPVGMPSIDLTLTDTAGQLIARRALGPADFRADAVLAPGGEAALQALLTAGNPRISGYTVEAFYP